MQIKGSVINLEMDVQVAKQGGGFYPGARFAYRDAEGKMVEKNFHNNVFKFNAGLKTQLSSLKIGDTFIAEAEKEGEFWNWKSISKTEGGTEPVITKSVTSPKSTYETPEERAQRQVYIVRQSSITNAIAFTNGQKDFFKGTENPVGEILNIAKQFENYVFDIGTEVEVI